MKIISSIILLLIFTCLSALHFYWAAGGTWGFSASLPTDPFGKKLINPTAIETTVVGIALLSFALYYLLQTNWITNFLPSKLNLITGWIIPSTFLLRAIGDFKYIGFFKNASSSIFAQADSIIYSPLCMVIALIGFYLVKSSN